SLAASHAVRAGTAGTGVQSDLRRARGRPRQRHLPRPAGARDVHAPQRLRDRALEPAALPLPDSAERAVSLELWLDAASGPDEEYVRRLWRLVLRREVEPEALDQALARLGAGMSRAALLRDMVATEE